MDRVVKTDKSFRGKPENRFSLKWNDFRSNLSDGFSDLLEEKMLVDVTLAADGKYLQAHKLVLSVCSSYFKNLFKVNPCKHPIVILKDVGHSELSCMLQFMYKGEVGVREDDLPSFLKLAHTLKVKGLTADKIETKNSNKAKSNNAADKKTKDRNAVTPGEKSDIRLRNKNLHLSRKRRSSHRLESECDWEKRKKCNVESNSADNMNTSSDSASDCESNEKYDNVTSVKSPVDDNKCDTISKTSESDGVPERSLSEHVKLEKNSGSEIKSKNNCDVSDDVENDNDEEVQEEEDDDNMCLGDTVDFDISASRNDFHDAMESDQTPQGHVSSLIITRAPRAFVWDYFLKETHQAICLNCGKTFKGQRPNTICEQHLRRMHPEFYKILLEKKIKRAELHMNPSVMGMSIPSYDHD